MRHYLGLSEYFLRQKQQTQPVVYQPESLINSHLLLAGMSGTGKSFQSVRLLDAAVAAGIEVDVFDVHEELDGVRGSTACKYSRATGYGHNPLVLDTNPHSGGVDAQVSFIVRLVREATPTNFGAKQEAALRNLLTDTYALSGIFENRPDTWVRRSITEKEREVIVSERRWSELRQYYPTLDDVKSFAKRKIMALTIGGDQKAVTAYEGLARVKARLSSAQSRWAKATSDEETAKLEKQIDDLKGKAIEAYADFINNLKTGKEIDDILKYDSVDVLTSVLQRIELLGSTGLLRANEPPFGNAQARVHQIKDMSREQQVLFVKLRLREIFERRKREGATPTGTELRHVIFLDEAPTYFSDDPDDIINIIAREARKFGIGLWCAAQSPTGFPEDFLTNVGATVLLGVHSKFWKYCTNSLRITEDGLKFIKAKEVLAIKLQRAGQADPPFIVSAQ